MKEKQKRPAFWLWIAGGLALGFALWNVVWYGFFFRPYADLMGEDYTETAWNNAFVVRTSDRDPDEWFTCSVKAPGYLATTGNLSIISRYHTHDLTVWLDPLSGKARYRVGVGMTTLITEGEAAPGSSTGYSFYIDENLTPEESSYLPIVEEYRAEIEELFAVAKAEWGIGATD